MDKKPTKATNLQRQKLIEAIVFFAKNVKNPTKMMIYKLLAELDFRHFEETGLSVTNLEYEAWKRGPVPRKLHKEITDQDMMILPADFEPALACDKFEFEDAEHKRCYGFRFRNKRPPNMAVFTPRQQRIMKELAEIYRKSTATDASKASHEANMPWNKTVKKKGEGATIDYIDLLTEKSPVSKDEAQEMMEETAAFQKTYNP